MAILKRNIFLSLIIVFHSSLLVGCLDDRDEIERINRNMEINGKIEKLYFDHTSGGRGSPTIELSSGKIYVTSTFSLICYAEKGDSIIKRAEELKFLIKRNDSTKIFYPEYGNWAITDSGEVYIGNQDYNCGKDLQ